jgi:hypothetical protein
MQRRQVAHIFYTYHTNGALPKTVRAATIGTLKELTFAVVEMQ